jgi:hypothetical protein
MKIQEEDYQAIKRGIKTLLKENRISYNEVTNRITYVKNKDLATMHFLVNKATIMGGSGNSFICDVLYKYMNDNHLDTALLSIAEDIKQGI